MVVDEPGGRLTAFQVEVARLFFTCPRAADFCWLGEAHCWRKD
ncbi:hypothetical protein [uncultured Jatrophihabitans sp.]